MAVSEAHKKASYKYNASRDSITIRPERSGYVTSSTRCGVVRCGCIVAPQRVTCQARCGVFGGLHKKHGAVL